MTRKILYTLTLAIVCIAAATDIYAQRRELTPDQKLRMAQALIQSYYVEDVDGQQLTDEAIKAML